MKYQELIKQLQSLLNTQGESLTIDGDMGPKTKNALEKFDVQILLKKIPAPDKPTEVIPVYGKITTGEDKDEGTPEWYRRMWSSCIPLSEKAHMISSAMTLIGNGIPRYMNVATRLNVKSPLNFAYILGVIHFKEASCNFKGVLHNGEKIVGTDRKTTLVPAGRGPFAIWEDSAVDAIKFTPKRWETIIGGSKDVGEILYALERYNGTGYITGAGKAENSPYLWAGSNINDGFGKYGSDGHFDATLGTGATPGGATLLKQFAINGVINLALDGQDHG